MTEPLGAAIDRVAAATGFAGVVRVDRAGEVLHEAAYGLADRANGIANAVDTRLAMASGTKGFTALVVVALVADGMLALSTTARSLLGEDLPLIADDVTVEHLLGHRSGIGDYIDEDLPGEITDYAMPVPVHQLDRAGAFLAVLDGFPTVFPAGERFAYNNGAFVVLAILAERAAGVPYAYLVEQRILRPAGLAATVFDRTDEHQGGTAVGYLFADGLRTNALHLPVVGVGDGGLTTTVADVSAFWAALFAGRIVAPSWVEAMVQPRSTTESGSMRYGLGFWLDPTGPAVVLEGYDAGISFRTTHDPTTATTRTVVANWSDGAWPLVKLLDERANENTF